MSAHTPGPWSLESYVDGAAEHIVVRGDGLVVAEIDCHHESVTNSRADARLIAAAPRLVAALERIEVHGDEWARQYARTVLAEAGI